MAEVPLLRRCAGAMIAALMLLAVPAAGSAGATGRASTATTAQKHSVYRLYRAYFLRAPDSSGAAYWEQRYASNSMSLPAISEFFSRSTEFKNRYGSLDDAGFVNLVYRNVLGRAPDSAGLAYWTGLLRGRQPRGAVMVGFSESPEFQRKTKTVPPEPAPVGPDCSQGCVPELLKGALLTCRMPVHGDVPMVGGGGIWPYLNEFSKLTGVQFVSGTLSEASSRGLTITHRPGAGGPSQAGWTDVSWGSVNNGPMRVTAASISFYESPVSPATARHELAHAFGLDHSDSALMAAFRNTAQSDLNLSALEKAHLEALGRRSGCR